MSSTSYEDRSFALGETNYRTQRGSAGCFRLLNSNNEPFLSLLSSIPRYRAGFCN
jgi:hypothetical protein